MAIGNVISVSGVRQDIDVSLPKGRSEVSAAMSNTASRVAGQGFDGESRNPVGEQGSVAALKNELRESVNAANSRLALNGQRMELGVDDETGSVVVRVSDSKTGEVVRQIPSEDALRITRSIDLLTGILVDQRE